MLQGFFVVEVLSQGVFVVGVMSVILQDQLELREKMTGLLGINCVKAMHNVQFRNLLVACYAKEHL